MATKRERRDDPVSRFEEDREAKRSRHGDERWADARPGSGGEAAVSKPAAPELVRSPHFPFEDASAVLIAENTAFRVHKSLLARKSSVLAAMFQRPPTELVDGLPAYRMEDTERDLGATLHALYHGWLFMSVTDPTRRSPWGKVKAFLRTATYYDLKDLREQALGCLQSLYPTTIAARDKIYSPYETTAPEALMRFNREVYCIDVANLAYELDLRQIYLQALYDCAQLWTDKLRDGMGKYKLKWAYGNDNIECCINARWMLAIATRELIDKTTDKTKCKGPNSGRCHNGRVYWKSALELKMLRSRRAHDPLRNIAWEDMFPLGDTQCWVCDKCRDNMIVAFDNGRQSILNNLEKYFKEDSDLLEYRQLE